MKTTHTATLIGADSRTPDGYTRIAGVRETKLYWVAFGMKYKKTNGWGIGDWPMYKIDLSTIKPIAKENL